jgi:hypothetical protein
MNQADTAELVVRTLQQALDESHRIRYPETPVLTFAAEVKLADESRDVLTTAIARLIGRLTA